MSTENLKKIVGFGLQVGKYADAAMKAESSLGKAIAVLPLLEDVPSLLGLDYATLKAEMSQLTPADLDDLNSFIDAKFSIPDADKEAKIEAAISLVIDLAKFCEKAMAMYKMV